MAIPPSASVLALWAVAAMAGLVGAVVLLADPRREGNRWLGIYLGLEAGSFALFGVAGLLAWAGAFGSAGPSGQAWGPVAVSLGEVFSVLGTGSLVYFASVFPRHRGIRVRPAAGALLAIAILGLLAGEVWGGWVTTASGPLDAGALASATYIVACYLAADVLLLRSLREEHGGIMRGQIQLVATGVLIATVPWVAVEGTRILTALSSLSSARLGALVEIGAWPLILWALYLVLVQPTSDEDHPGARPGTMHRLHRTVAVAFGLFTVLWVVGHVPNLWEVAGASVPGTLGDVGDVSALVTLEIRWAVLAGAMLVGFSRHGALGFDERAWRIALAVVGAIGAFALVGAVSLVLGPWWGAALAAVLVLGVPWALDRVRPSAEEQPYLREQRLSTYRSHLESAQGNGDERDLARLRQRLGVTKAEHDVLAAVVEAQSGIGSGRASLGGRFDVVERLGAGGSGTAYLVRDREGGEPVVLKRLHPGVRPRTSGTGEASTELEVAQRVSHPNLVAIHDVLELDRGTAILMEHVEGGSLADRLQREPRLSEDEVALAARDALDGLAALHEAGVVHGDVKPANLLVDADGTVKLADFGIARVSGDPTTRSGSTGSGTPGFMAPEQVAGEPPRAASDVYALARTCVTLLTGEADGGIEDLSEGWERWLEPALARDPADRYPSASAMRSAMGEQGLQPEGS